MTEILQLNHNCFLDYTKDEDEHLVIKLTEAEFVKRIYCEYLKADWRKPGIRWDIDSVKKAEMEG